MKKLKNKKYIALSILAITFVLAFIGQVQNIHASSMKTVDGITYGIPEDEGLIIDAEDGYEMNGVKYSVYNTTQKYVNVLAADNASEVETLFLYYELGDISLYYTEFDISQYTSLKNVYILSVDGSVFYPMLAQATTAVNLYHVGNLEFTSYLAASSFQNIYYISPYQNDNTFTIEDSTMKEALASSKIENIYYTNFNKLWIQDTIDTLNSENITNKNNLSVNFEEINDNTLDFTREELLLGRNLLEVFYPTTFGMSGYSSLPVYSDSSLVQMIFKLTYQVVESEDASKVTNLISYANYDADDLPNKTYSKLAVMHGIPTYFTSYTVDELIVGNSCYTGYLNYVSSKVNTIRFYYNEGMPVNSGFSGTFAGQQIYIPNEYKEYFQDVIDNTDHASKIIYYNQSEYQLPNNAFLSDNETEYEVSDPSLSISYLESKIVEMEAANYEISTEQPVDITISEYDNFVTEQNKQVTSDFTNITLEDESVWISDIQQASYLTYYGDYTTEELLKIISNYVVWLEGERSLDHDYKVKLYESFDKLSVSILEGETQVNKSTATTIRELDESDIGNFVLINIFGTASGTLLLDSNETYTKTYDEIYEYILTTVYGQTNYDDVDLSQINDSAQIQSYYTYNEKNYFINMYVETEDFDSLIENCSVEVDYQKVISPDDDKEDYESEYNIELIDKIYVHESIEASTLIYIIEDYLLLKNDELSTDDITIAIAYTPNGNSQPFEFNVMIRLPDGVWYLKSIEVEIIDNDYRVGFLVFDDGTLFAVTHYKFSYTKEDMKSATLEFLLEDLNLTDVDLVIADTVTMDETKSYEGSTYNDLELIIINSGVESLNFSTEENPVDETEVKQGYTYLSDIYYTDNYDIEDVIKVLSKNFVYYNGQPLEQEYVVQINKSYEDYLSVTIYLNDVIIIDSVRVDLVKVTDSDIDYIYAKVYEYNQAVLILEIQEETLDLSTFYSPLFDEYHNSMEDVNITGEISLNTSSETTIDGIFRRMGFNYYEYETLIKVIDLEETLTDPAPSLPDVEDDSTDLEDDTLVGDEDDLVDDLIESVKENRALQIALMTSGTLLGLALLYISYKGIKKVSKWLKD